jgi:hypothetical protein
MGVLRRNCSSCLRPRNRVLCPGRSFAHPPIDFTTMLSDGIASSLQGAFRCGAGNSKIELRRPPLADVLDRWRKCCWARNAGVCAPLPGRSAKIHRNHLRPIQAVIHAWTLDTRGCAEHVRMGGRGNQEDSEKGSPCAEWCRRQPSSTSSWRIAAVNIDSSEVTQDVRRELRIHAPQSITRFGLDLPTTGKVIAGCQ